MPKKPQQKVSLENAFFAWVIRETEYGWRLEFHLDDRVSILPKVRFSRLRDATNALSIDRNSLMPFIIVWKHDREKRNRMDQEIYRKMHTIEEVMTKADEKVLVAQNEHGSKIIELV